jgi:hypothetical protein
MTRRLLASLALAVAGCAPASSKQFAIIDLLVRDPADVAHLDDDELDVFFAIDGGKQASVTFPKPQQLVSPQQELGDVEHTMVLSLTAGQRAVHAIGRANPITIPAFDTVVGSITIEAPLLLAAPNVPEALDDQIPSKRHKTAACDEADGAGWFVGGVDDGDVAVTNAYRFEVADLRGNDAFGLQLSGQVGCDGDDNGGVTVFEPSVNRVTLDAARAAQSVAVADSGGDDSVAIVHAVDSSTVWIASATVVAVIDRATKTVTSTISFPSPAAPTQHLLVLDARHAVRFSADGGAESLTVDGGSFDVSAAPVPASAVAVDPSNATYVSGTDAAQLTLITVSLVGGVPECVSNVPISFHGILPDEMLTLPDGRVVGLAHDASTIDVDITGSAVIAGLHREHMMQTVGGAVILFGGDPGHDVLVAP